VYLIREREGGVPGNPKPPLDQEDDFECQVSCSRFSKETGTNKSAGGSKIPHLASLLSRSSGDVKGGGKQGMSRTKAGTFAEAPVQGPERKMKGQKEIKPSSAISPRRRESPQKRGTFGRGEEGGEGDVSFHAVKEPSV